MVMMMMEYSRSFRYAFDDSGDPVGDGFSILTVLHQLDEEWQIPTPFPLVRGRFMVLAGCPQHAVQMQQQQAVAAVHRHLYSYMYTLSS